MSVQAEHLAMVEYLLHQNLLRVCALLQELMQTQTFQTSLKCRLILAPLVVAEIPRQWHLDADLILLLVRLGLISDRNVLLEKSKLRQAGVMSLNGAVGILIKQ